MADFNPRSREGSDVEVERMWYKVVKFQSTLPRRERHRPASKMLSPRFYFNPRSREGSDIVHLVMLCAGNISIHAPAKGATFAELQRELEKAISIHAPAKGATESHVAVCTVHMISIHAPAKGATYFGIKRSVPFEISIHAPAKGATNLTRSRSPSKKFQSTLPRRERRPLL